MNLHYKIPLDLSSCQLTNSRDWLMKHHFNGKLDCLRGNRSRQHPQVPLHHIIPAFDDPQVHTAIRNFHAKISSITIPVCITCMEKFPGTKMKFKSLECCRCSGRNISLSSIQLKITCMLETFLHNCRLNLM